MLLKPGQVRLGISLVTLILFLSAIAVRLAGAWWYAYSPNPDYAVVVQMARHIAAGTDFPVFFYGQAYMGSLEPSVSALLVFLFGPSPFIICLGTALVSFLLLLVIFRTALKISGCLAACVATSLCIMGPMGYFHYMCSPRGGYALCLLLTTLLLQMGCFVGVAKPENWKQELKAYLALGFVAGLGFWNFWLVIPAIATVGIILLLRLRFRLFRWCVWVPGLTGFLLGSLPWWIWNVRHSWASLESSSVAGNMRLYVEMAKTMFNDRIPTLIGFSVVKSPAVQTLVFAFIIFLGFLPFLFILTKKRRSEASPVQRLSAVVFVYLALFTLAFATSNFASIRSPRYMLPLVPVFAIWAGCGIGELYAKLKAAQSTKANVALGIVLGTSLLSVVFLVFLSFLTIKVHRLHPRAWYGGARELMEHPHAKDGLFADFVLFGLNWATDEKVCAVSPRLWRYLPYALRMENAESPGVLENMGGFNAFLKNTNTRSEFTRTGGYRLDFNVQAPQRDFAILPATNIVSICDDRGTEWRDALVDANGQTCAYLTQAGKTRETALSVHFAQPVKLAGIRAVTREQNIIKSWSIAGRNGADSEFVELSELSQDNGFFWSGPRFYSGGIHSRAEKLFPAIDVTELRLELPIHWSSSGVFIETLQFLVEEGPRTEKDLAAVCSLLQAANVKRVFADRWAANRIHHLSGGALWTLREPTLTAEAPEWACAVPAQSASAVVVAAGEAEQTRNVFSTAGVICQETPVGGMVVFVPTHLEAAREAPALQFYAGQLFNNLLPAASRPRENFQVAYCDGKLVLQGISEWTLNEFGERVFVVALDWKLAPGFSLPKNTFIFFHCLNDKRKIVFQLDEKLLLDACPYGDKEGKVATTVHRIPVPASVPEGDYRVLLGILKPGFSSKRLPPNTLLPVDENRVVLPLLSEIQILPPTKITQTNGVGIAMKPSRFIVDGTKIRRENGAPFFWLADTAWELFHRYTPADADRYLETRASQQFTVIQAVLLAEKDGLRTPDRLGNLPFSDLQTLTPVEAYWQNVDRVVEKANSLGLVMALVATWGDKVTPLWGIGPKIFTVENARQYGHWVAKRYEHHDVIWVVGGDRPVDNAEDAAIWRAMALGIREAIGQDKLITFHPVGGKSSSTYVHNEAWLDFNMLQSGHRGKDNPNWKMITDDLARVPLKPVLDGEPNYEDHPVMGTSNGEYFTALDIRKSFYRSVLSGACGYTYGCHSVWQGWDPAIYPATNKPLLPAMASLALDGAKQMRHGRALGEWLLSRGGVTSSDALLSEAPKEPARHMVACHFDGGFAVYTPVKQSIGLRLDGFDIPRDSLTAAWYDPRTGEIARAEPQADASTNLTYVPEGDGDWVLLLTADGVKPFRL